MENTKELTGIQKKREQLKKLSKKASDLREAMLHSAKNDEQIQAIEALTLNEIIIKNFHTTEEHSEFKTFKGWMKEGFHVKKGEKAFLIWGRPKDVQEEKKTSKNKSETEEGEDTRFFPISFIFSNAQVKPLNND